MIVPRHVADSQCIGMCVFHKNKQSLFWILFISLQCTVPPIAPCKHTLGLSTLTDVPEYRIRTTAWRTTRRCSSNFDCTCPLSLNAFTSHVPKKVDWSWSMKSTASVRSVWEIWCVRESAAIDVRESENLRRFQKRDSCCFCIRFLLFCGRL